MRSLAEAGRIQKWMVAFGATVPIPIQVYFTGGVSAVLLGWRASTIDIDVSFVPNRDEALRVLPGLKEKLEVNIELASPAHFPPELPGWSERSRFIGREGNASYYHYDFYGQALAKIERDHVQDRLDVRSMIDQGLVEPAKLRELFKVIVPNLYRFPAVDPPSLGRRLDAALGSKNHEGETHPT